jgi:RNA polymerase sigma-70 factor, ECF subfamily
MAYRGSTAAMSVPVPSQSATDARSTTADDEALMQRYSAGDVRAFETLYRRHKEGLYRYLQHLCGDREAARDLFQEVWRKVIASRERYQPRAQFRAFLFSVAHNCAMDFFRRRTRQPLHAAEDVEQFSEELICAEDQRPEVQVGEEQLLADLQRALQELPLEQRAVFMLHEESGLNLEEIGRMTGVAMETAKSRLRYAIGKLRRALQQHHPKHRSSMPT